MNIARVWLSLECICFLSANSALAQKAAPQTAAGGTLTIDQVKGSVR